MKGRKPKDVGLKLLNGNPGKRPLGSVSDTPFVQAPLEKPVSLDEYASAEWDRLVDRLAPILSPASAGMVFVAVHAFSRIQRAEALLKEAGGEIYETVGKSGRMLREHPAVGMRDRAVVQYHRALAELGASPVAHTRVRTLPEDKQTELPGIGRLLG